MSREEVVGRPCITMIRCTECLRGCEVFRRGRVDDARVSVFTKDGSSIETWFTTVFVNTPFGWKALLTHN